MKCLKVAIALLLLCAGSVEARKLRGVAPVASNPNLREENVFGLKGAAWLDAANYYAPGTGNPAVSTDDWYHSNGVYNLRPYDLTAADCGSVGASIAASRGRYAWVVAPDHGNGNGQTWNGSFDFRIGYSNDPGVLPSRAEFIFNIDTTTATVQTATLTASISNGSGGAGNILTVTAATGTITNDNHAKINGAGVTTANITAQTSGSQGSTGNYTIDGAAQLVASQTMTVTQANYAIYQQPSLVCNPDDASFPFYIYAEGTGAGVQHEQGMIKSADLLTWSGPFPTHATLTFGAWSSYQRVKRNSAGSWQSQGFQVGWPQNGNVFARSTWTSTDGQVWTIGTTNLNACYPASSQVGTTTSCAGTGAVSVAVDGSPHTITVGAQAWQMGSISTVNSSGTRVGSQWVGRAAVDANTNVIDSPAPVMVSSAYEGNYPGPTYVQGGTGYVEDGVAHYYALKGWPISSHLWFVAYGRPYLNNGLCKSIPNVNGTEGLFQVVGSISGTTLTVTSVPINSVVVGGQIIGGGINPANPTFITNQLTGSPGGTGTYTVSISQTVSSNTFTGAACGGLWQQAIDYYTEIIDATAAAGAAPIGVKASCSSSVASLTWFNALPTSTYRLYRGTTAGSQTTLVGDFSGTSATDSGMTLNAVTYYKLVYLNGGVEQKNRVVSTYCSTSSAFVNAHMTRALAAGADASTCNRTWMDTFDAWLVSNGLSNNLMFATMVEFCVIKDGSNIISKIFDMGSTRLPRGGDYTTQTTSTTYSATGINGNPAWVNGSSTARGYYGGNRSYINNIRRKTQITFFAAYQKPGTASITPFVKGQFASASFLQHGSGSPGTINFTLTDATQQLTASASVSGLATDFHTAAGVFDGTNLIAYSDAVAGTPVTGLVIPSPTLNPPDGLTGQIGSASLTDLLASGGDAGLYARTPGTLNLTGNQASYNGGAQIVFDKGLPGAQVTSLHNLIRSHYGF